MTTPPSPPIFSTSFCGFHCCTIVSADLRPPDPGFDACHRRLQGHPSTMPRDLWTNHAAQILEEPAALTLEEVQPRTTPCNTDPGGAGLADALDLCRRHGGSSLLGGVGHRVEPFGSMTGNNASVSAAASLYTVQGRKCVNQDAKVVYEEAINKIIDIIYREAHESCMEQGSGWVEDSIWRCEQTIWPDDLCCLLPLIISRSG